MTSLPESERRAIIEKHGALCINHDPAAGFVRSGWQRMYCGGSTLVSDGMWPLDLHVERGGGGWMYSCNAYQGKFAKHFGDDGVFPTEEMARAAAVERLLQIIGPMADRLRAEHDPAAAKAANEAATAL